MLNILVADIMTREPYSVSPETSLMQCARIMIKQRTGSLLLVIGKKLVGIISRRDILWALVKKTQNDLSKIRAIDISPRKIATIKSSKTIEEAMRKMKKFKFERLPVIQNKELVGIITMRDIINFHPDISPELKEYSDIKEEEEKIQRLRLAKKRKIIRDGICEECGNRDMLVEFNGMLICESCRDST